MQALVLAADTAGWIGATAGAVAAIATVGALIAAFLQIKRERDARHALEGRAETNARREQATKVSGWIGDLEDPQAFDEPPKQRIELLNDSNEPVYRAVVYLVYIQGAAPHTGMDVEALQPRDDQLNPAVTFRSLLSVIPPGRHHIAVQGLGGILSGRPGVELAFTDRVGVHWLRATDGSLTEIDKAPTDYYGIDAPYDWGIPEPS